MNLNFDIKELLQFDKITPEVLDMQLDTALKQSQNIVNQVSYIFDEISWGTVVEPMHYQLYHLNYWWDLLNHFMSVVDNQSWRDLHAKWLTSVNNFYVELMQNEKICNQVKIIEENQYNTLNVQQQKVIKNELRDFNLNGIFLDIEKKLELKQIKNCLSDLNTKFEQNLLDATDVWCKYVDLQQLRGIPEDIIAMYQIDAKADGYIDGFAKITLQMPSYLPVMQYCEDRELREELYKNYVTRASEFGDSILDNTSIIKNILRLRDDESKLLNFSNYAELSLYTKMAKNTSQVLDFLLDLANQSKSQALHDLDELTQFANIGELQAWDIAYYSEKLREQKYSYSTNELKQYFQLPVVINGLFKLVNYLYNIDFIKLNDVSVWHNDVIAYQVIRGDKIIGHIYMDLCARKGKQSGAWMNSARSRYLGDDFEFTPIAYIICNFTSPIDNKPTLLTIDEVETLFHEMGHALHHLLSKVDHYTISGLNGVEWDAVELPSQFMEHFVWNNQIIKLITKHIDTGQSIPDEFYNKLLSARFFQSGLQILRQIEFSLFDILLHSDLDLQECDYLSLLNKVRKNVAVIIPPSYNRFPNSFAHIFAGGYAAGYYSYKWAEVLACDVFSVFDNLDPQDYAVMGAKFLDEILSKGGLKPMEYNFKQFMGRDPDISALLKYSGIAQPTKC